LKAHRHVFVDDNIEAGEPDQGSVAGKDLVLLDASKIPMSSVVDESCKAVFDKLAAAR
jgi:hypothetical protein